MKLTADITAMRETSRDTKRDNGFTYEYAAICPKTGRSIVTARIYQPGTVTHCSIWIHGATYGRGQGKAGGYGYHKASAAMDEAIRDAGIILHGDVYGRDKSKRRAIASIGGVGETAMQEAVEAIARAVSGKRRIILHVAHA